jgi:hypothetical protein
MIIEILENEFVMLTEEDVSTDNKNFRDVYCTFSSDGGTTWSGIANLTGWIGLNYEQVFPSVSKKMDGRLHLTFLQKTTIGRYDATNNPGAAGTHDIMYMVIDTADIRAGVTSLAKYNGESFMVGQNYPNPFNASTTIPVSFKHNTSASISIVDVTGKLVYNQSYENIPAGNADIEVSLSNINTGIYFYTVEAEGIKVTRKMIVE